MLQLFMGSPIVIVHGELVDYEFNLPFTYLRRVVESNGSSEMMSKSSTWVRLGASEKRAPSKRRSSPVETLANRFESSWDPTSDTDAAAFLAQLRFEKRHLLDKLPLGPLE